MENNMQTLNLCTVDIQPFSDDTNIIVESADELKRVPKDRILDEQKRQITMAPDGETTDTISYLSVDGQDLKKIPKQKVVDDNLQTICKRPMTELIDRGNFLMEVKGELKRVNRTTALSIDLKKKTEKVLLYYGYPIAINGAWSTENAVNIYKNYNVCVFGDEYNSPTHETYEDTVLIFNRLKEVSPDTKIVGYVPIGLDPSWPDSNLTMDQLKERVDLWTQVGTHGVDGIFLDEYGYDYNVTRERQNEIVGYCKSKGLFVFANSWSIEYVFSKDPMILDWIPGFEPNPNGLAPLLDENDYYLYENLFYTTERDSAGNLNLNCASVWRIDDVLRYYTEIKIEGKTYYDYYKTKICSLDGIPSTMDVTHKNILQSISVIGAAILNITAVAFGDENWGATGYYHQWDLPELDLYTNGVNGVMVDIREYTKADGTKDSFPYKWTANLNGHTYSIVFDIPDPDHVEWVDGMRYASVNDIMIENAWMTIFEFQTDMRLANEKSQTAIDTANKIKQDVDNVLPTLSDAEANIKKVVAEAEQKIADASKQLEAGLSDLSALTSGFGFKEIQW